jgi:cytochrome c oxidase subunit II
LLPPADAVQALTIDRLFNAHFFMIALLFSLIGSFLIYSIVVFRAKPGDKSAGSFFKGNSRLEIFWTVIPLMTVIIFSFFGARNLAETRRVDPDALVVKVTASQWAWLFEYPEYGFKAKELYLPVNRQVLLRLTSRDVIHSFWVPEFRVKQDALPGENLVKELRITPIKTGTYKVLCAELCGGAHADMVAPVVVANQADFETWITQQLSKAVEDPVERGKTYAETTGCLVCHSVDGTHLTGPTFKGVFGSQRELTDGSTVTADENYLRQAILDPNAQIVKGYAPNVHPGDYASLLTEQQVTDMLAFIRSIK